jgi:hypothetical protein
MNKRNIARDLLEAFDPSTAGVPMTRLQAASAALIFSEIWVSTMFC